MIITIILIIAYIYKRTIMLTSLIYTYSNTNSKVNLNLKLGLL